MTSQYTQLTWETAASGPKDFFYCYGCSVLIQPGTIYFIFNYQKFCCGKCLTEYEWDNHDIGQASSSDSSSSEHEASSSKSREALQGYRSLPLDDARRKARPLFAPDEV